MSDEPALVRVERRDDGVAVVTLDNPKVNALSAGVVAKLTEVGLALQADPPGAVVVTGGERIFAAGADINGFVGLGSSGARSLGADIQGAMDAIAGIPRMVIAAVSGYALGGGCELALACDIRIASEKAVFGQPEILLGLIPGAGGTQRLPRLVGPSRAKDLILSGRQVNADEAFRIGLADEVVPHEQLHERALALAAEYAARAAHGAGPGQAGRSTKGCRPAWRRVCWWSGSASPRPSTPRTARSACRASSSRARAKPSSPAADPPSRPPTGPPAPSTCPQAWGADSVPIRWRASGWLWESAVGPGATGDSQTRSPIRYRFGGRFRCRPSRLTRRVTPESGRRRQAQAMEPSSTGLVRPGLLGTTRTVNP